MEVLMSDMGWPISTMTWVLNKPYMQAFTHIFESIQQLKQKHVDDERRNAEALKLAQKEIEALLKQV